MLWGTTRRLRHLARLWRPELMIFILAAACAAAGDFGAAAAAGVSPARINGAIKVQRTIEGSPWNSEVVFLLDRRPSRTTFRNTPILSPAPSNSGAMGVTSIMPPAPTAAQLVRPKHEGNCRSAQTSGRTPSV